MTSPIQPTHKHAGRENQIPLSSIVIEERMRRDTSEVRRYIEDELVPSIAEHGLINPVVLDDNNSLIAGWCRTQAFLALGHTTIPFVRRTELSPAESKVLEIEENLRRRDMHWTDYVLGIYQTHLLKMRESAEDGEKWGQRQTGKLLGVALGHVNNCVLVAKALIRGDEEVLKAPHLDGALKIFKTRKADEAIDELAKRAGVISIDVKLPTPSKRQLPGLPTLEPSASPTDPLLSRSSSEQVGEVELPTRIVPLSEMLFNVDCVEWMNDPKRKECADLILTDIPYGIDMDNLEQIEGIDVVRETHGVEENVELMPKFIQGAWKILKPDSYLIFFYDVKHQEKLVGWLEQTGFKVQPFPLIWCKTHPCRNQAAHCHWTKATEYAMVARKGQASMRDTSYKTNYFMADGMAEKKLQKNPFSKPFELLNWIMEPITIVGQTVVDPFAGGGSILRAAIRRGLKPIGLEIDSKQFPRLQESVKGVYNEMTRNRVQFT